MHYGSQGRLGTAALLIISLTVAVALAIILTPDDEDTLDHARAGMPIRVGYAFEPPFVIVEPDGFVSGESPEVLRAVLAQNNLQNIEWLRADFGKLLHELESGRIDIIATGMFITPEREKRALFSQPTALVRTGLLQRINLPHSPQSLIEMIHQPGMRLAVLDGAIESDFARQAGMPAQRIVAYPDTASALAAMRDERVEAFALSTISLRYLIRQAPEASFVLVEEALPGQEPGRPAYVFRKQDAKLRNLVNKTLSRYLGSPDHLALVGRFGFSQAEIPRPGGSSK